MSDVDDGYSVMLEGPPIDRAMARLADLLRLIHHGALETRDLESDVVTHNGCRVLRFFEKAEQARPIVEINLGPDAENEQIVGITVWR